jgi:cytochrome c-type biogenesis protein
MGALLLGTLAGALTTLSPCVLPILPFVVLGALDRHRFGPLALAAGLIVAFAGVGMLVYGAGWVFDISSDSIRLASATMLVVFGAFLLSTTLTERFSALGAPASGMLNRALERFSPTSIGGQFALGALLGAVWSPCSGPTLGAAVSLAASGNSPGTAVATMIFFGAGASLPLLAVAYGSRQTLRARRELFAKIERRIRPALGAVLIAAGLLVLIGLDRALEAAFVNVMPHWLVTLTTRY